MKYGKYLILVILFCFIFNVHADDDYYDNDNDDTSVDRQRIYPIYQDVSLIPTVKIIYDKPRIVVKATYPWLNSDSGNENIDTFNNLVDGMLFAAINDFKNQAQEKRAAQNDPSQPGTKNQLTIDFDTSVLNTTNKPIISIRFNLQSQFAGMTHAEHHHQVLNFDLAQGERMELSDLFRADSHYLDLLAAYSRTTLEKKLRDKTMILYGTTPTPENYHNWNLSPQGLLITFDEAAPSVYGTQIVLIPYSELTKSILPGSSIAHCLQRQKKCLNNHLLTGGFMEEA